MRRAVQVAGWVSEDWNVDYIGYSHSPPGQLIKYLIKIFQEEKENMNELMFASPPGRYLKDIIQKHISGKKTCKAEIDAIASLTKEFSSKFLVWFPNPLAFGSLFKSGGDPV